MKTGALIVPARWVKGEGRHRWQSLYLANRQVATLDYGYGERKPGGKHGPWYRVMMLASWEQSVKLHNLADAVALIAAEIGTTYDDLVALPGAPEEP